MSSAFGLLAEAVIGANYLRDFQRSPRVFFPASETDFQDISIAFGNQTLHLAFLAANNPGKVKDLAALADFTVEGLRMSVPDLLTHDPARTHPPSRAEFYEIKANSITGRAKGRRKIRSLTRSYGNAGLPYVAGDGWSPKERIRVFHGVVFGIDVDAFFQYFRTDAGLVVYELCLEGFMLAFLTAVMLAAIAVAIILWILEGGLKPVPTEAAVPARQIFGAVPADLRGAMDGRALVERPVGRGGTNALGDTRLVQLLLNDWLRSVRHSLLAVDGRTGPLTIGAITEFQRAHTRVVDGRIDPGGPTILALASSHLRRLTGGITPDLMRYSGLSRTVMAAFPRQQAAAAFREYWSALRSGQAPGFDLV